MKLLDTNVFVYAHGRPHPYAEPCRALLSQLGQQPLEYTIDTELLQEIMHIYSVRGQRSFGLTLFDDIFTIFPDPNAIGRNEILAARRVVEEYPAISPRDAIHAAVVRTQGLEGIVTTDKALGQVAGVTRFDPAELAAAG